MGALQHPDLPADVRATRGAATAHPGVIALELRPEGPDALPRVDARSPGSARARPVRSGPPGEGAGGNLLADPGGTERPGLGGQGPAPDRRASTLARLARDDPCLGVQSPSLAAGVPGGLAQGGANRAARRRTPTQPGGADPDPDRWSRPAMEGDRKDPGGDEPARGLQQPGHERGRPPRAAPLCLTRGGLPPPAAGADGTRAGLPSPDRA